MIVADDENLETARDLGFAWVERDNRQLGRKINDGYELAGREGFEFMVPFGSDDWVDPAWIQLPEDDEVSCARMSSVVNEEATLLAPLRIPYEAGDGVRVYPRALLEKCRFRPAGEDTHRAIDTGTWERVRRLTRVTFTYTDLHPFQIVDWKSKTQLNSYKRCLDFQDGPEVDPWEVLADHYPPEALADMQAVYGLVPA